MKNHSFSHVLDFLHLILVEEAGGEIETFVSSWPDLFFKYRLLLDLFNLRISLPKLVRVLLRI